MEEHGSQLGDLILCAFAASPAGLILVAVFDLRKYNRAKTWPLRKEKSSAPACGENDSDGTSYEVAILYEYSVNGVPIVRRLANPSRQFLYQVSQRRRCTLSRRGRGARLL